MILYEYLGKNLFSPPYRKLPHAVFVFFLICFFYYPQSPLHTFTLSDSDDYMRLAQVANWLQGHGWYDVSQPRLSPGAHTVVHWSRLVDLPIALFALPLIKLFGMEAALFVAGLLVPPLLGILLLVLLPRLARPLLGERANLAVLLALFAPMMLFNFSPGRVDHHGYQILIAGFGLLCLTHLVQAPKDWRYALYPAAAFACGLWIGVEALPWILLFIACLAVLAALDGKLLLRNAAIFGAALAVSTTVVLPLALPVEEFSRRAVSWFSMAYVIFAWLVAGMFSSAWLIGRQTKNKYLRLGLMGSLGFFATTLFFYFVPDACQGPFANYDAYNSTIALANINEARPLGHAFLIDQQNTLTIARAILSFFRFLLLPLLALIAIVFNLRNAKPTMRPVWAIFGAFLLSATLLTLFWQGRVGYFMQLFTLAPLAWLLVAWWEKIARKVKKTGQRLWAQTGALFAVGPLPVLLLPALYFATPVYPDLVLFPATRAPEACPLKPTAEFIGSVFGYWERTYTIMSGMNEGPQLLFRTQHNVIAANYNVPGNQDAFNFFNARDDKSAQAVLKKWKVDLVLTCKSIAPFMAGFDKPVFGTNAFLQPGKDGKLHLVSSLKNPSMIERLVNGEPPAWLKQVEIPISNDYLLFEVHVPDTNKKIGFQDK